MGHTLDLDAIKYLVAQKLDASFADRLPWSQRGRAWNAELTTHIGPEMTIIINVSHTLGFAGDPSLADDMLNLSVWTTHGPTLDPKTTASTCHWAERGVWTEVTQHAWDPERESFLIQEALDNVTEATFS